MVEVLLSVRVTPRSARDEVLGWEGRELRVRLRAPPVEGRANEALLLFLSSRLGLPKRSVELAGGAGSRLKRVRISGMSFEDVQRRLQPG